MREAPHGAEPSLAAASLKGLCPRCGARGLFDGLVRFETRCRRCGLDFAAFNVGDGPAAFLTLILGAVIVPASILTELAFSPPLVFHLVWVPVGLALTIFGLRVGKAALLRQEYRHEAREGRIAK